MPAFSFSFPAPRTNSGRMMVNVEAPAATPEDFKKDLRESSLEFSITRLAVEKIVS
jgi:hypothetical protein